MDPYTDNIILDDFIDARLATLPEPLQKALTEGNALDAVSKYLAQQDISNEEKDIIVYKVFLVLIHIYPIEDLENEILIDTQLETEIVINIVEHIKTLYLKDLMPHLNNALYTDKGDSLGNVEKSMESILTSESPGTGNPQALVNVQIPTPQDVIQSPELQQPPAAAATAQQQDQTSTPLAAPPQTPAQETNITERPVTPLRVNQSAIPSHNQAAPTHTTEPQQEPNVPSTPPSWNHVVEEPIQTHASQSTTGTALLPNYQSREVESKSESEQSIPGYQKPLR